ncbi:MAG: serine/threonine protein kinase [Polyangiales bacterium]
MTYPSVGSYVAGRYRIDAVLGEGGMGAVFAATDANGHRFALKFPSPEMRTRPGMMGRFANEAVATSRIASEHVVKVFGVEATEQGVPFMVMELLEGTDLDQILEKQAPVDIPRAVHFALGILRALQVAHAHGVVHRDLKPSNVFITPRGNDLEHVTLIDFGITTLLDADGGNKTATSVTMGTPAYMSPEQAKSAKAAEPRSDLYSVGVILYELLTKKRPYEGDSNNDIVVKICTEPPLPIREARPDLPQGIAKVVEHALVKSPAGRYENAVAFVDALEPWADARSAGVIAEIRSGVPPLAPDVVIGTGRGQTAEMAVASTDPGASDPGRQVQRTVVADGPLFVGGAPPANVAPMYGSPGGTEMGTPAPVPPVMTPMNGLPPSGAPAVIPSPGGGYERPRRSSNGGLLVVLGIAAVGLIGTGVYFAAFSGSSSPPPAPTQTAEPAKKPPADDEGDDDDNTTKKKKKKNTDPGEEPVEPTPSEPVGPSTTVVPTKPKTDAGVAKTDAAPTVDATPPPSDAKPPGTTTAPTVVWPPDWKFPGGSTSAPPTSTTPPPATTTPPPATTTAPPPTGLPPIVAPPPATTGGPPPGKKKPKFGGG